MNPRPLIGISTYLEDARWGVWSAPAAVLHRSYVAAVQQAGGLPVLLPPGIEQPDEAARDVVAALDAVIVAGGADVDPARYAAQPHSRAGAPRRDRDDWECALIEAALRRHLPLLGICRGMQLMNVVRGGTLHQHLPDLVGHEDHAPAPGRLGMHHVRLRPDSTLGRALGTVIDVPTYHHQAVDALGTGVRAVAWAQDGTVEAIELADRPSAVGVQWHPEEGADARVFQLLVGLLA